METNKEEGLDLFVYQDMSVVPENKYYSHVGVPYSYGEIKTSNFELIDLYPKISGEKINSMVREISSSTNDSKTLIDRLEEINSSE